MDKPWTMPGLTSEERTLTLLGRPLHRTIVEALDAHARDAAPKWTKTEELPPTMRCRYALLVRSEDDGELYEMFADWSAGFPDIPLESICEYWMPLPEPPREATE